MKQKQFRRSSPNKEKVASYIILKNMFCMIIKMKEIKYNSMRYLIFDRDMQKYNNLTNSEK